MDNEDGVLARQLILNQKRGLIELKKEKVELLNQLKDAYDDLEAKEKYVSELVTDYEIKTRESVEYVRQVSYVVDEGLQTTALGFRVIGWPLNTDFY